MNKSVLDEIISKFKIELGNFSFRPISQGYINDTFLVSQNNKPKYILQRINSNVFKNITGLHQNLNKALTKLVAKDYVQIKLFRTFKDELFHLDKENCWRLLNYIPESTAYNYTSSPKIAHEAGRLIGQFHQLLKNEDIPSFVDTVPNLNYLPFHIKEFNKVLEKSSGKLQSSASGEIAFAKEHLTSFNTFYQASLPKRICHNDTKLNNFLFDNEEQGLCLIDLDTIMPGYFHYDFGDAVRTVVSQSNEDEKDLKKISFNITLFKHFIVGLQSSGFKLSDQEMSLLPISCALMPFMHGVRALTDFLNGNIHYKVSYPEQNLDRCKSLFRFASLALEKQEEITLTITNKLQ